jgi:hypothetical protein
MQGGARALPLPIFCSETKHEGQMAILSAGATMAIADEDYHGRVMI